VIFKAAPKAQKDQTQEAPLVPNYEVLDDVAHYERLLNRLTGLNRFQSLKQRTQRMSLRVCFLEKALLGLADAQEKLSGLCTGLRRKSVTN